VASKSGSGLMSVLPYVAIGGLLYLMAKNSSALKSGTSTPATPAAAGTPGNNCGTNDFGVTGGCCWCGNG
jgi:hypothetical protein